MVQTEGTKWTQKGKHRHKDQHKVTFGLSSRICWRMSLCFSSSLSCLLLCASSNFTHMHAHRHTRTISGWNNFQVEMKHIFLIKWHNIHNRKYKRKELNYSLLVWCTAPLHWQKIGWSPASLWGEVVFPVKTNQSWSFVYKRVFTDT